MKMAMASGVLMLLALISVIGIGIFIQVKLSRSENKFLGLILPIITFLNSILIILVMAGAEAIKDSDGIVEHHIIDGAYLQIFFTLLITNIPTVILMGIYVGERNKINTRKSIDKMRIDDL